ncbi:PTS sugar transporter subunit IID [Spirochaetia bacterium]|nr:PTS sugar transporter subunit IID [Spirochaetia bacterium]
MRLTATNLKKTGMPLKQIADVTGLSMTKLEWRLLDPIRFPCYHTLRLGQQEKIGMKFGDILKKKDIEFSAKRYGIDALGAMAQGLFASLLIGTIINTIGERFGLAILVTIGNYAKLATGPAMAVAIGYALKAPPLVLFSLIAVGGAANTLGGAGGPLAVFFVAVVAAEVGKLVSRETKIDIIVTPAVTIAAGVLTAIGCAPAIGSAAMAVGSIIIRATELQPFFMGIIVSVVVGMALTLPISSAAICAALGLTGLAGGAAVAGCCAQMVGFAVMSFRENKWGGLFAQGLGTSMLQMGNIVKNPRIWIAPTAASVITGPLATCVFRLQMNGPAVASGMGTCGLVGQIGIYSGWLSDIALGKKAAIVPFDWLGLVLICFILPAVLTLLFAVPLRKTGWIRPNDLKLEL